MAAGKNSIIKRGDLMIYDNMSYQELLKQLHNDTELAYLYSVYFHLMGKAAPEYTFKHVASFFEWISIPNYEVIELR